MKKIVLIMFMVIGLTTIIVSENAKQLQGDSSKSNIKINPVKGVKGILPSRIKHDWQKSEFGEQEYKAKTILLKKWNEDGLPLVTRKILDNQGNQIESIAATYRIFVNATGSRIYIGYYSSLSEGQELFIFLNTGKLVKHIVNFPVSLGVTDFTFDDSKILFYNYDPGKGIELNPDFKLTPITKERYEIQNDKYLKYYLQHITGGEKPRTFAVIDKQSKEMVAKLNEEDFGEGVQAEPRLLGMDSENYIYILTRIYRKHEMHYETPLYVIRKISINGKEVSRIFPELNENVADVVGANRLFYTVDFEGGIYQLMLDKEKFEIIKWSHK